MPPQLLAENRPERPKPVLALREAPVSGGRGRDDLKPPSTPYSMDALRGFAESRPRPSETGAGHYAAFKYPSNTVLTRIRMSSMSDQFSM